MYICVYICTCIHTYKHTYMHICQYIYICIYIYIYVCIHAHIHTYIHTNTHICMQLVENFLDEQPQVFFMTQMASKSNFKASVQEVGKTASCVCDCVYVFMFKAKLQSFTELSRCKRRLILIVTVCDR